MQTEVLRIEPGADATPAVERAAAFLRSGRLVVFPTETVYALAASAGRGDALERLWEVKGLADRPPLTLHVRRQSEVERYVPAVSPLGRRMMEKGWPGPLTLIFKLADPTGAAAYAELDEAGRRAIYGPESVGVRCPDHPLAERLVAAVAEPLVATGAHGTSRGAPVMAEDALRDLDGRVDLILDAGRTRYARPSTIVTLNGRGYQISRPGVYDERMVRRLANYTLLFVCSGNTCRSPMAEGLARQMLARRFGCRVEDLVDRGIALVSAGTMSAGGAPATPEAVRVLSQRGIDLSGHRAQALSADLVRSADRVYTMTASHAAAVREVAPDRASHVERLDAAGDVTDPVGGSEAEYEQCAARIAAALEKRLAEVPL